MKTNRYTVKLYWEHMRKYKPSFFAMLICIPLAATLLDLLLPYALSILALVAMSRRAEVPAALMVPFNKGER